MAKRNGNMGRQSVFRGKKGGQRIQGLVTRRGGECFEGARRDLARLTQREPTQISDADVIEFLARGTANTRDYLAGIAK